MTVRDSVKHTHREDDAKLRAHLVLALGGSHAIALVHRYAASLTEDDDSASCHGNLRACERAVETLGAMLAQRGVSLDDAGRVALPAAVPTGDCMTVHADGLAACSALMDGLFKDSRVGWSDPTQARHHLAELAMRHAFEAGALKTMSLRRCFDGRVVEVVRVVLGRVVDSPMLLMLDGSGAFGRHNHGRK